MAYEKESKEEIGNLLQKQLLKRNHVETLYSDVFLKVICKLGCRPSVLTGCTREELKNAERLPSGDFSILVEKQKEKLRHSCIEINESELNDFQVASSCGYTFLKKKPQANDPVFPSLSKNDQDNRINAVKSSPAFLAHESDLCLVEK